jgi:CheY-like chemotaxis protein
LGGRGYVLLVDDDSAMAEMYRLGLEGAGFRVKTLPDAMDLNDKVREDAPDMLVLDWEMPGVRGDEALERLRGTDGGRELPVFILSNFSGSSDRAIDRVFRSGALAWLEKVNTTPVQLAEKVAEALGSSRPDGVTRGS